MTVTKPSRPQSLCKKMWAEDHMGSGPDSVYTLLISVPGNIAITQQTFSEQMNESISLSLYCLGLE